MTMPRGATGASRFPVLGSVLTVAFLTLTGLAILVWVSLTLAIGSESVWSTALVLAVVPALLIAWAARMVFRAVMPRPPSYLVVAVTAYVAIVVVAGTSVWLADRAYRTGVERAAQACSADEVAALRGIVLGDGLAVDPTGERDGSCRLEQQLPGDRDAAQSAAATAMSDAGFVEVGDELGARTYERDGITVLVVAGVTDDKGMTPVSLTVPAT